MINIKNRHILIDIRDSSLSNENIVNCHYGGNRILDHNHVCFSHQRAKDITRYQNIFPLTPLAGCDNTIRPVSGGRDWLSPCHVTRWMCLIGSHCNTLRVSFPEKMMCHAALCIDFFEMTAKIGNRTATTSN